MATSSPHPTLLAQTAIQPIGHGSRTITIAPLDSDPEPTNSSDATPPRLILRARPLNDTQHRQQRVQWGENVVDNEGLGRKKSKVCCIYNKPKAFDESSDESDDSHSDSDCCPQRPSTSGPCPPAASNAERAAGASTPISSPYTLPTPPRSPNAYEAEPSKAKGKGKAG